MCSWKTTTEELNHICPYSTKIQQKTNSCPELALHDAPMLAAKCLTVGRQSSCPGENLDLPCQDHLNL